MTKRLTTEAEALAIVAQIQNVTDLNTAPDKTLRMLVETLGQLTAEFERRGWNDAAAVADAAYSIAADIATDRILAS